MPHPLHAQRDTAQVALLAALLAALTSVREPKKVNATEREKLAESASVRASVTKRAPERTA